MKNVALKLNQRLQSARELNERLAKEIGEGNGATGMTATFFANASRDLMRVQNQVRSALNREEITINEYNFIMNAK